MSKVYKINGYKSKYDSLEEIINAIDSGELTTVNYEGKISVEEIITNYYELEVNREVLNLSDENKEIILNKLISLKDKVNFGWHKDVLEKDFNFDLIVESIRSGAFVPDYHLSIGNYKPCHNINFVIPEEVNKFEWNKYNNPMYLQIRNKDLIVGFDTYYGRNVTEKTRSILTDNVLENFLKGNKTFFDE